jgi:PAS domain S-box-containing protein
MEVSSTTYGDNAMTLTSEDHTLLRRCAKDDASYQKLLQWYEEKHPSTVVEPNLDLQTVLEHTTDIICVRDSHANVVYVSPSVETMLGYTPSELIGTSCHDLYHPDDLSHIRNQEADTTRRGLRVARYRHRLRTAAGEYIWCESYSQLIRDRDGEVRYIVVSTRDIDAQVALENDLWQSKAHARYLLNSPVDVMLLLDQHANIVDLNDVSAALFNHARESLLMRNVLEFIDPDLRECYQKRLSEMVESGTPLHFETRFGNQWFNVVTYPVFNVDGTVERIAVNGRDITESKQLEHRLQQSENRFRQMFERNRAVKLLIDPDDGSIVDANPAACDFYGYTHEQIRTMHIHDINILPANEISNHMRQALAVDRTTFEFQHRTASGKIHDVMVFSSPVDIQNRLYLYSIIVDVTEQHEAEQALRESEYRYRGLFEQSNDAVVLAGADGSILQVNQRTVEMFGYTEEEFKQLPPEVIAIPERHQSREKVVDFLLSQEEHPPYESVFRHKNGSEIPVEINLVLVRNNAGELTHLQAVIRDISSRKQQEYIRLERERLRIALQKEQELHHLKTKMMTRVGHEFRTPLTVIMSSAELLQNYFDRLTPERREHHLQKLQHQVHKVDYLLNEMSMVVNGSINIIKPNRIKFDLNTLCLEVIHQTRLEDENRHQFSYAINAESTMIMMDHELIRKLLQNLLSNAVKFSEAGTLIAVRVDRTGADLIIAVKDEGIGIPTDEQSHIFDAFYRASNVIETPGMGLGLAKVHEITRLYRGQIDIDSGSPGTTFTVTLRL